MLGSSTTRGPASGTGSLATRLALGTLLLVMCVTALVLVELTRSEWQRLVESKRTAATMVANLFASSVAAALDFGDQEAVQTGLDGLRSNPQIIYAAVMAADKSVALAEYPRASGAAGGAKSPGAQEAIEVTQPVLSPTGGLLGSVLIRVSLEQEEQTFRHTRLRLVGFGGLFAVLLAGLLVGVARRELVLPLSRLQGAAVRLAQGERVQVPVNRNDEIGRLSHTFNSMAASIDERERRIASQNERLQALLDNMGQAILVFGADRLLTEERSRSAERWLGARAGLSIVDTLYPAGAATDIERQAFEAWIDVAFCAAPEDFQELLELAPQHLTRGVGAEEMSFDLIFRLPEQTVGQRRLMLLATDVTQQRRLERSVAESDRQHQLQLSALRRLASGGGQLFVGFLENTRRRLDACRELLNGGADAALGAAALDRVAIEGVFQQLHTVRAEARCFDLVELESKIAALEAELMALRQSGYALASGQQSSLQLRVAELGALLEAAERLFVEQSPLGAAALDQITVRRSRLLALAETAQNRSDRSSRLVAQLTARPLFESFALLPEAAVRWAERAGKNVRLEIAQAEVEIPFGLSQVLGGVLSHLVRNAIAHGIEPEAERLASGKPVTGKVLVSAEQSPLGPIISVADDGRGFVPELRDQWVSVPGVGAPSRLPHTPNAFLSTTPVFNELSGAGVGIAAVRSELNRAGYRIYLSSTSERGTELKLTPIDQEEQRVRERHVG
jgi:two-component system, chemotaxis family, sensor kinase CheA